MICNNISEIYRYGDIFRICVMIRENKGIDPSLPLDQAVAKTLCIYPDSFECGPIQLLPETAGRPERAVVSYKLIHADPQTGVMVVFRNHSGKTIVFVSSEREMFTAEAQAMVNSFVLGNNTSIIAPDFLPSKPIKVNDD
jgi:hypothetical protein